MDKPLLCVSWLNGQVKAVASQRGVTSGTWERPGLVADFNDFKTVLAEAAAKTRAEGRQVAMVLAHPRLSQQVVEVPPAKGRTLDRILERNARNLKTFNGEPAWAVQPAMPTKNSNASLLQIFPQPLVDQLAAACEQNGLQLVRLLSTTAVLSSQLKKLPLQKDELALLAAETGTTTTIVIGGSDGRVCLSRVLLSRWNQKLEPLSVELMRTIGFAEQQSGRVVASVWVFGAGAEAHTPALESLLHLPVKLSPVEWTPFYWTEQAGKLPEQDDGNLISQERREAPQRRRLLTLTTLLLILLLLGCLAAAGFIEVVRKGWLTGIQKQNVELTRLQEQKANWLERNAELARKTELVRMVLDSNFPQTPALFFDYLTEAVPKDLLLTELRVTRTNDAWLLKMAGTAQPTTNASPANVFHNATDLMTNKLVTGPFHVKINRSVMSEGLAAASVPPGAVPATNRNFVIEGVIP